MVKIKDKHPLAIRWFHWLNFPILTLMLLSGLWIYWANDVYKIPVTSNLSINFFPEWFYKLLDIPFNLARGMAWHFTFMWFFIINGFLYVSYTIFSGEWRLLLPAKNSFREAISVTLYDLGISKVKPVTGKFNGAQRIAYTMVIIMGAGSLFTGLAIYKPVQLSLLTAISGGYETARLIHFILAMGYVVFFIIHVLQVIRAGWNNFRAMVTGFEVVK